MENVSTMTVEKSTHIVETVRIKEILPHPDADSLGIVKIADYSCCVKLGDFKPGDLAAFIPPDSEVKTSRPEFAFLDKKAKNGLLRIRTQRLRGIVSYGLLVKAPEGLNEGDNAADALEVMHWQPAGDVNQGEVAKPPSGTFYKYDVDSFMRWGRQAFIPNELVFVSEKIHGESARMIFKDGIDYCGSRTEFKKEYPTKPETTYEDLLKQYEGDEEKAKNAMRKLEHWRPKRSIWWTARENTPEVDVWCKANPGWCLYGEVYGQQGGGWGYGLNGKYKFAAFDILKPDGNWLDAESFLNSCKEHNVPTVPIISSSMPFDLEQLIAMADRNSIVPGFEDHIAEGIVVQPIKERWDERVGRVKFKIINPAY